MERSDALKAMLAVAGGLAATVAASGPVRANCGAGGGFSQPRGGNYSNFDRPQETSEQRAARLAESRARREARRLARAEREQREAAAKAPARTAVASNN